MAASGATGFLMTFSQRGIIMFLFQLREEEQEFQSHKVRKKGFQKERLGNCHEKAFSASTALEAKEV